MRKLDASSISGCGLETWQERPANRTIVCRFAIDLQSTTPMIPGESSKEKGEANGQDVHVEGAIGHPAPCPLARACRWAKHCVHGSGVRADDRSVPGERQQHESGNAGVLSDGLLLRLRDDSWLRERLLVVQRQRSCWPDSLEL